MSWAADEFKEIDLGDARLNKRAVRLVEQMAAKPMASIPQACGGWSETQAAYRFFAQEEMEWETLLSPHWKCTEARMAKYPVVLCVQDTTELNFNGQGIQGLGPLSYEAQRGMYVHTTYAVTPQREPLGVTDAWMWAREPKGEEGQREGILESTRWIEGYARVGEMAARLPGTRLVYLADREGDMIELMRKAEKLGHPADWLIRSQHNRAIPKKEKLWDKTVAREALGELHFTIPSRVGQKSREVKQSIWAKRVVIRDGENEKLEITCVVAKEENAPQGAKPIEWRLLTNRLINTLDEAAELIDWYRARWEIEIFFNVLKNGCRIEALQLSTVGRLERALALFMVVAWRINYLMRLGRAHPDLEADLLFDRDEWEAAYVLNRKKIPPKPPKLNEVLRLIAVLGGFLARKGDGEPGVKTIWLGLQRVVDFTAGLRFAREGDIF